MTDLQDRLGRLAPTVDAGPALDDLRVTVRRRQRRRRLTAGVVASIVLVASAVGAVAVLDAGDEDGTRVVTEPQPGRPAIEEGWIEVPEAPLPDSFQLATDQGIWTGEEFLWWGLSVGRRGSMVGAAFDPEAGRWRSMAAAPIGGRISPAVVWSGQEMIVWGGRDAATGFPAGAPRYPTEAAAYDPDTDSWRRIAEAPIEPRESTVAAVWDGQRMVVVGGSRFDGPAASSGLPTPRPTLDGAAYDPVADDWEPIAAAPEPLGETVTWDGEELLTFHGLMAPDGELSGTSGWAYDPATDRWRELSGRTTDGPSLVDPRLAAAGGLVVAVEAAGNEAEGSWFTYDRPTDGWVRDAARPPVFGGVLGVCSPVAARGGDTVAVLGCGQALRVPPTSVWYELEPLPVEDEGLFDVLTVGALAVGDRMVMALNPSPSEPTGPERSGPTPPPRFVAYQGDFSTYVVPDVEGLTLGEARRLMADAGFVLSVHEPDPQGDDAVVRAQAPPGGTEVLGLTPEVGVRTDPAP